MTLEAAQADPGRGRGTGWLIILILLVGLVGAGFLAWHFRAASKFDDAAEVSIEDFLSMKKMNQVREAWLDRCDLYARVDPDFIRDGRASRFVHLNVPQAYLLQPSAYDELKSGIDPSRFTVIEK